MAPPKSTVVAWNYFQKDGFNLSCQLCGHNFTGTLTREVDHLLGISNGSGGGVEAYSKITDEQKATVEKDHSNSQMQKKKRVNKRQRIEREIAMSSSNTINLVSKIGGSSSIATQAKTSGTKTLNQFWKLVEKQEVDDAVAEYFYAYAIPFNVASPYFKNVIKKAIDFGKGYVPPGSEALRKTLLKRAKDRVTRKFVDIKESWKLTGCTILSDGWSDLCHRPLINVLIYCPQGVLFLKAINAMDRVKTSEFIFGILDEAIQEVGVANVFHVVTDNASNCVSAGKLIMEKYNQIYWTPCVAHYLDLMLHDLAKFPWVNETIRRAKTISNFIINHRLTLRIYRKNASKELLRPCDIRFATFYITLKRVVEEKASLRVVFCNTEWERSTLSKETKGKNVEEIVLNNGFWENANKILKICGPIINVLCMVDGDKPCMGFVYESLDRCKEAITAAFNNVEADYKEIWDLIDHRWKMMHSPLHAAACYLDPILFGLPTHKDEEIMNGLIESIEKLNPDLEIAGLIRSKLRAYRLEEGLFGTQSVKYDRRKSDQALCNLQLALKNVAKESSNSSTLWIDPIPNAKMDDVDLYIDSDVNTDREFTDESGAEASSGFIAHTALDDIELFDVTSGQ
eukprot:PITA_16211